MKKQQNKVRGSDSPIAHTYPDGHYWARHKQLKSIVVVQLFTTKQGRRVRLVGELLARQLSRFDDDFEIIDECLPEQ